jgi:hypothetical protein
LIYRLTPSSNWNPHAGCAKKYRRYGIVVAPSHAAPNWLLKITMTHDD